MTVMTSGELVVWRRLGLGGWQKRLGERQGDTLDLLCSLSLLQASTVSIVAKLPDIWSSKEAGPRMSCPFHSIGEGI
jgi:hypothetical protein